MADFTTKSTLKKTEEKELLTALDALSIVMDNYGVTAIAVKDSKSPTTVKRSKAPYPAAVAAKPSKAPMPPAPSPVKPSKAPMPPAPSPAKPSRAPMAPAPAKKTKAP